MPLNHIEIRSFKSIVEQQLDLGRVNVFIGANGAGKSNLLEAIGVLSSAMSGEVSYASLAERGVRLSAPEVFKASFLDIKRPATFALVGDLGNIFYGTSINPKSESQFHYATEKLITPEGEFGRGSRGQRITRDGEEQSQQLLEPSKGLVPGVRYMNNFDDQPIAELLGYAIYAPSTPILRGISQDSSFKEPLGLYGGSLAIALQDVIQDMGERGESELQRFFRLLKWFKSIGATSKISRKLQSSHVHTSSRVVKYTDKFMKESFNDLYAYDVSEGALYVLFVLVLLLHKESPNIFALDNVDSALNPILVRELMRHIVEVAANDGLKQVFMTTHNPTSLDAIDLFDDHQRLFTVARNKTGHTEIRRVEPPKGFTREQWRKKYDDMRLSEIWLAGLIGGESSEI